jgi:hypothetical protein
MWRAVVSQPLDRTRTLPKLGDLDEELGEFWAGNAFSMPRNGDNLSAYERNRLFLNKGDGGSFLDASFASGADIDSDSRTVVAADFDRDGRPDLLVGSVGGGSLRLFLNRHVSSAARLAVELQDANGKPAGSGCRVILEHGNETIVRDLFASNSCLGQAPAELLVGVGSARQIDKLTVRWPDGTREIHQNVPINGRCLVRRGQQTVSFTAVADWYLEEAGTESR